MSNLLRESSNKATPVLELLKGEMTMDDYLNGNQKIIRKRRQQEREQDENFEPVINNTTDEIRSKSKDSNKKPLYTYASLIGQAILQAPNRRLPLNEIYEWIMVTYPFYKKENKGWQNSIRHNLTLCPAFRKVERESGHHAKGSYWTIPDEFMCCFVNGAYKNERVPANNKRKKRSKTGDNIMSNDQPVDDTIMSNNQPVDDIIMNSNQPVDDNARDTFMFNIQPADVYNHQIIDIFQYSGGLTEMGGQASDIDDFINDFSFTDTLPTSNKTFQEFEHYQTNFDNVNPDPDGLRYFYAMKCNVKQECERYVNMREVEFQHLD
ncbi:forkhead box protein l1 [Gigaspora margarita]|uniref:Forkhead box protein l1 n=1 Tax=Gigaspora margarita TaxID=4874 RepID=A0A8H3X3K6_GIGMA|nr:forkhead box protein l1 [Gigaspora margarita]